MNEETNNYDCNLEEFEEEDADKLYKEFEEDADKLNKEPVVKI